MTLIPVTEIRGGVDIRPEPPRIERFRNVLFTPHRHGGEWGLFERSGAPIEAAIDRKLPTGELLFQQPVATVSYWDVKARASLDEYIYVGQFNGSFGDFLVETLPRFWVFGEDPLRTRKLLIHSISACNFFEGFRLRRRCFGRWA